MIKLKLHYQLIIPIVFKVDILSVNSSKKYLLVKERKHPIVSSMLKMIAPKIQNLQTGILYGTSFIYHRLAFDFIGVKMDSRVKELILQG